MSHVTERLEEARRIRAHRGARNLSRFSKLERYCAFVGQPRSGHSVLGALINAHRNALVSHNLDALDYLRAGVAPDDLFSLILERDRWLADQDREIGGYSYDVPGLWTGYVEELRVIGDKRAGATSRHLMEDPTLLRDLPARVGLPVSVIHHVRNPWDNIASIAAREGIARGRSLPELADYYFSLLDAAQRGIAAVGSETRVLRTYHEDLIREPKAELRGVFALLDLPVGAAFLDDAARFLHAKPRPTRHAADWPAGLVDSIAERAQAYEFLDRYSFDA